MSSNYALPICSAFLDGSSKITLFYDSDGSFFSVSRQMAPSCEELQFETKIKSWCAIYKYDSWEQAGGIWWGRRKLMNEEEASSLYAERAS